MGIHMGCKDAPSVAYGHEYQPMTLDGKVYFATPTPEQASGAGHE